MSLRLLFALVTHAALTCGFLASPSRWSTAAPWTWLVLTIAVSLGVATRDLPHRNPFHITYLTVAIVAFVATGLNYHGSTYWMPSVVYDYYRPQRWDVDFDGITSATKGTLIEAMYRRSRNRVATAALSIPVIAGALGIAALYLCRSNADG